MNCYYKKEVNAILAFMSEKCAEQNIFALWQECETKYLQTLGIKVSPNGSGASSPVSSSVETLLDTEKSDSESNEKKELKKEKVCKCQWEGCIKTVCKPIAIDDKIFCYLHRNKYIKQSRQEVQTCAHIFSSQSKLAGQRCQSKTIQENGFCCRHQKKKLIAKETKEIKQVVKKLAAIHFETPLDEGPTPIPLEVL
jgi:hypothetical protein